MASVSTNRATGRRSVQFSGLDGKRRTIRLGKVSKRFADAVASHVEHLLSSAAAGEAPPVQTVEFLTSLSEVMYSKLVAAGLVMPREASKPTAPTLAEFCHAYLQKRTDVKQWIRLNLRATVTLLTEFFQNNPPIDQITAGDAEDFARWLKTVKQYAPATSSRTIGRASQLFNYALKHELVRRNPFAGVKRESQTTPARQAYVPVETIL